MIYLDDAELERLTGYVRPADQRRKLDELGVPYIINARGRNVVRRDMDKTATTDFELGPVR